MALFSSLIFLAVICCHISFISAKNKTAKCDSKKDKWQIVFRGLSGTGERIMNAYLKGHSSQCLTRQGCLPNDVDPGFLKRGPSDRHLSSPFIMRQWNKLKLDKAKLELYKDGKTVVRLEFNAYGSSYNDWFVQSRLTDTSFSDLYSRHCVNTFGMNLPSHAFLIGQDSNCVNNVDEHNYFWVAIIDSFSAKSKCKFSKQSSYPTFLYATGKERSQFNKGEYKTADEMAIYVSYGKRNE